MGNVLILGLGNILLRDEGLGVRALELLSQTYQLPPEVELCDGDCLGLALLPRLEGVRCLLVVDAGETGKSPGTIERLEPGDMDQRWEWKLSVHETSLSDLLSAAALQGHNFDKLVLFAMQPASISVGLELSEPVQAALPRLVRMMASELEVWGVVLKRRATQEDSKALPRR